MAKKASSSDKTVTRIKASEAAPVKTKHERPKKTSSTKSAKNEAIDTSTSRNPFKAVIGYFVGAWHELRQVRWPDRRATWSLTFAVLAFSGFFVIFILLLDAFFKYIFEILLK